jgi:hypothetical protein
MSINPPGGKPPDAQVPGGKPPTAIIPAIGGFFLRLLKAIFIRKKDCCK